MSDYPVTKLRRMAGQQADPVVADLMRDAAAEIVAMRKAIRRCAAAHGKVFLRVTDSTTAAEWLDATQVLYELGGVG